MTQITRRNFLRKSGLATGAVLGFPAIVSGQNLNSRPRVACIGVGGKGKSDTENTAKAGCDIVGICDVDGGTLDKMGGKFPKAKKYQDFRKMLSEMDSQIDGVTVSTPDHGHGVAGIMAMQMGKHVYVQKPLAQTVWESRMMRNLARDKNLATQMGNQGSSEDGLRRSVEVIQAGVIGKPLELHVWTNRPVWPQGLDRPEGSDPIPDNLDWDLWLGPAQPRPYKKGVYHTFKWRGWKDFGTGALGDMACHTVNMPFRALKLGYPNKIECEVSSRTYPETFPLTSRVRFEFPERDGLPPIKFWWYEGNPSNSLLPLRPYSDKTKHVQTLMKGKLPKSGALIIGEKGEIYSADDYGRAFYIKMKGDQAYSSGNDHPDCKKVAQSIPRAPRGSGHLGHHIEWVEMMKDPSKKAYSNFEIAAYLNEVILLGVIAQNIGEGKPIGWDGPNMKATDNAEASKLVKRAYRDGWEPKI